MRGGILLFVEEMRKANRLRRWFCRRTWGREAAGIHLLSSRLLVEICAVGGNGSPGNAGRVVPFPPAKRSVN